jgi:hypothetical protein
MGVVVGVWHCRIKVMPWHSRRTNFLSKKAFCPEKVQDTRIINIFVILLLHLYLMAMAVKLTVYRMWCRVLRCVSEKRPPSVFKGGGTLLRNIDLLNHTTSHPES